MRGIGWAVAWGLTMLAAACGAPAPTPPLSAVPPAPDAATVDPSERLPADAPLTGVIHLRALGDLARAIGARSAPMAEQLTHGAASVLARADLAEGLGLRTDGSIWFALRFGGADEVTRAMARVGEVLASGDGLDPWLAAHPLPPAWMHLRVVGPRREGTFDVAEALSAGFGGTLTVLQADPPAMWAQALDVEAPAAAACAAALGQANVVRVLGADLPTLVVARDVGSLRVLDVLQDQELGHGALAAAIHSLPEVRAVDQPLPSDLRVAGPVDAGEAARVHVAQAAWVDLTRALGSVQALQILTGANEPFDGRTRTFAALREAAQGPAELMQPGADVFGGAVLRVGTEGSRVTARVDALYGPRGRPLSQLTGGRAPLAHGQAAALSAIAVTLALDPAAWRPVVLAVGAPPNRPWGALLGQIVQCGLPCLPAAWVTLPAYARDPVTAWASVFDMPPAVRDGLGHVRGANLIVLGEALARRFAAALRLPGEPSDPHAVWTGLTDGQAARWATSGSDLTLFFGTAEAQVAALAEARPDAAVAAGDVLQITATLAPASSAVFEHLDGRLSFEARAMVLQVTLRLRSLSL
mgnify:CR=1 FL=1